MHLRLIACGSKCNFNHHSISFIFVKDFVTNVMMSDDLLIFAAEEKRWPVGAGSTKPNMLEGWWMGRWVGWVRTREVGERKHGFTKARPSKCVEQTQESKKTLGSET